MFCSGLLLAAFRSVFFVLTCVLFCILFFVLTCVLFCVLFFIDVCSVQRFVLSSSAPYCVLFLVLLRPISSPPFYSAFVLFYPVFWRDNFLYVFPAFCPVQSCVLFCFVRCTVLFRILCPFFTLSYSAMYPFFLYTLSGEEGGGRDRCG